MNPGNLKSKVVPLELAKRMAKLGWKKKTEFYWIDVGVDEVGWIIKQGCFLMPNILECPCEHYSAPLSCEILEEFKSVRFKPLMNTNVIVEIVQVKTHVVCLLKDVWDNVLHEEKSDVLVEALANLWNWYQENNKEE